LRAGDQGADRGPVRRGDELYTVGRQACADKALADQFGKRLIAVNRLGAASQDGGIA
jgi:hypothetical protein